jgi:protein-disulfide isomerase
LGKIDQRHNLKIPSHPFYKTAACSIFLLSSQSYATTLYAEEKDAPSTDREIPASRPKIELRDTVEIPIGSGGRTLGKLKAPLVLLEFTDYECPYCVSFHEKTFPELKARFIDKGILRFMVRDLPLDFHPYALPMAKAARCGEAQSAFWKVNSVLYLQPFRSTRKTEEAIDQIAKAASIDAAKFQKCFASTDFDKDIAADMANAASINVTGTPMFILGRISGNKLSGIAIPGAYPIDTFVQWIQEKNKK